MTKSELLRTAKPILFNTDMIRAILDGRKTVTRRVVKRKNIDAVLNSPARKENPDIPDRDFIKFLINAPCRKGKNLYIRETWAQVMDVPHWDKYHRYSFPINQHEYIYKADNVKVDGILPEIKWHPSIHMPKEAARIFLEVTDVRVERLQDITNEQVLKEGISKDVIDHFMAQFPEATEEWIRAAHFLPFSDLWNSTIKKQDFDLYGWNANPWVWVIEFERIYPDK